MCPLIFMRVSLSEYRSSVRRENSSGRFIVIVIVERTRCLKSQDTRSYALCWSQNTEEDESLETFGFAVINNVLDESRHVRCAFLFLESGLCVVH